MVIIPKFFGKHTSRGRLIVNHLKPNLGGVSMYQGFGKDFDLCKRLACLESVLKVWNQEVFGDLRIKKQ